MRASRVRTSPAGKDRRNDHDLKTAASEAVTNCTVHAYPDCVGPIVMTVAGYPDRLVKITVADKGIGIPDIP